jgi:hypothetical protein
LKILKILSIQFFNYFLLNLTKRSDTAIIIGQPFGRFKDIATLIPSCQYMYSLLCNKLWHKHRGTSQAQEQIIKPKSEQKVLETQYF